MKFVCDSISPAFHPRATADPPIQKIPESDYQATGGDRQPSSTVIITRDGRIQPQIPATPTGLYKGMGDRPAVAGAYASL